MSAAISLSFVLRTTSMLRPKLECATTGRLLLKLWKLEEDGDAVGANGLEMEVVGSRCAAAWPVVEGDHVGANFFCQMQNRGNPSAELLRAMYTIRDRAMERKDRKGIREEDQILERDAAFFRRHVFGTQEAGAGGDGFRIGIGERRATSSWIHLDDDRVTARGERFSFEVLERTLRLRGAWAT